MALQKRPGETKTFTVLLEDMLDGDTISTVVETVPAGLTIVTAAAKNSVALVVRSVTYAVNTAIQITLSGGTEGAVYVVSFVVTSVDEDIHEVEFELEVVAKYDSTGQR